ncbi:MAG: hypothetical protein Q8L55_00595, partial [Phycisphaerales bacterium]|nr:hypothetical protein [Phycisphaerales bacterium]
GPRVTYQYGMEFVTVPGGNQVYPGGHPNDPTGAASAVGRGAVAEDFRIGRYEVGRASWNAFFNAAEQVRIATGQAIPWLSLPGVTVNHRFQNAPSGGGPSISSSSSIVQYR